jgi:alpha-tubulin suppressor-like RCC1 family protein
MIPTNISGYNNITKIFTGIHNIGFINNDKLYVCGNSDRGQINGRRYTTVNRPFLITHIESNEPIINVKKVAFGRDYFLILTNEHLYYSGDNPQSVNKISQFRDIVHLFDDHQIFDIALAYGSAIIVTNRGAYGIGDNSNGQLGLTGSKVNIFTSIPLIKQFGLTHLLPNLRSIRGNNASALFIS